MDESPAAPVEPMARDSGERRASGILPWAIAATATLIAVIAIVVLVVLVVNQASEPRPVAQLTQDDSVEGTFAVDEDVEFLGLTAADFISHGSYGALEVWSTTTTEPEDLRCLAIVAEGRVSLFRCSAPTFDTIADFNIEPSLVPPAPSGEPAAHIRFILRDDVVGVYLAPDPEGGYY